MVIRMRSMVVVVIVENYKKKMRNNDKYLEFFAFPETKSYPECRWLHRSCICRHA